MTDRQIDVFDSTKITSKVIPFKCVVCNGWGTVSNQRITCHACNGKGYILVENTEREKDETNTTG